MSAAAFPTMRWRRALAWLALVLSAAAHAQDPLPPPVAWPEVPERGASAADFAPAGWRVELAIDGRLDGDDRADLLILLRMDDPANVLAHDGMGVSPFDSNPRMLVLALADGEGYRRVLADHRLIPRPYSPTADDVLGDGPGSALRIGDNRVFTITLTSWSSAGSWSSGSRSFAFRLQDGCARLVGFDEYSLHRASGEISERSNNFLTGRGWTRTGHVSDEGPGERQWRRLPQRGVICLEDVGDGFSFEP